MSQKIARERIERLFELAEERTKEGKEELAHRYMELARKIGMSYNVPIPKKQSRRICSECNRYLKPGVNCKVRIKSKDKTVNYECEECGNTDRYGYK